MESPNRRLVRPPMADSKDRPSTGARAAAIQKKQAPPETTNAENFYYVKQMQTKTPLVVILQDGEELHGVIEWYDKLCLKLTREEGPNLLIFKSYIKYIYKQEN